MKHLRMFKSLMFVSAGFSGLNAQEVATKWDVEIPEAISDEKLSPPLPKPAPLDLKVINSRTTRMEVIEASELHDLPPVTGTINVTVQLVEDPHLPDPPPLPVLPPSDPAVVARMAEMTDKHRGIDLIFLSATVYDHNRTLLTVYPDGTNDNKVTAWSNLDFNHFCGFASYRVKDAHDGTLYDFGVLMGIGNIETERWAKLAGKKDSDYDVPKIPEIQNLADGGPAFVVLEGDAKSPAMDTLEQLHDLYRKEGKRLEQASEAREKARAERKAYLLANPPIPKDISVQFWKRNTPSPVGVENLKQGVRP